MNFAKAFYDFLASDATLTAMLQQRGDNPGVYTTVPVPKHARFPYVVCATVPDEAPAFLSKQYRGVDHQRDIGCYVAKNATRSIQTVDSIADRVVELFDTDLVEGFLVEGARPVDVGTINRVSPFTDGVSWTVIVTVLVKI